jgi:hypothetical protein
VLGAGLREVDLRLLEDADQVDEPIHHRLALACAAPGELSRVDYVLGLELNISCASALGVSFHSHSIES